MDGNFVANIFGESFARLRIDEWHDHELRSTFDGPALRTRILARMVELRDAGVRPRQVVVIRECAPLTFIVNYLAAGAIGAVVMPVERGLPAQDERRRFDIARPAFVLTATTITSSDVAARMDLPDAVAQVMFTGGTTGSPKAVLHTRHGLESNLRAILKWTDYGPEDRILGTLPLFHCFGINWTAIAPLVTGSSVDAFGRLSIPRLTEAVLAPTAWPTVPAAVEAVLRSPSMEKIDWTGLRFCISGGAPTASGLSGRFIKATGRPVLNAYGVTEATSFVAAPRMDTREQEPGDVGAPADGVGIRAGAVHGDYPELELGGPAIMAGYLDDADATERALTDDGWLRTGDLYEMSQAGTIVLRGRLKNFINRGGEKVDPASVAEIIARHPSIVEAYVFGYPDDRLGEIVACVAEVAPSAPAPANLEGELRAFAAEHLPAYAVPALVRVVAQLPRTAVGKIIPAEAQQLLA